MFPTWLFLKSEIIISKLFCLLQLFSWPTHLADLTNFILGDTITIATCLTLFKMKQQNLLRMDFDSIAQFLQQDICNVNCTDDQLFLYIQKGLIWNFFFISQNFFLKFLFFFRFGASSWFGNNQTYVKHEYLALSEIKTSNKSTIEQFEFETCPSSKIEI